jgi:hypothetical protein
MGLVGGRGSMRNWMFRGMVGVPFKRRKYNNERKRGNDNDIKSV